MLSRLMVFPALVTGEGLGASRGPASDLSVVSHVGIYILIDKF